MEAIDIFLQPGEHFAGDSSFRLRTLLGSCVSVTLWHAGLRTGAMSHFLLPARPAGAKKDLDGRYAEEAIALMLRDLARMGVRGRECVAKIVGGGNMFPGRSRAKASVGARNGEAARELLGALGIPVLSEHLFGEGHRQIVFELATGDLWVRQVKPQPCMA